MGIICAILVELTQQKYADFYSASGVMHTRVKDTKMNKAECVEEIRRKKKKKAKCHVVCNKIDIY